MEDGERVVPESSEVVDISGSLTSVLSLGESVSAFVGSLSEGVVCV